MEISEWSLLKWASIVVLPSASRQSRFLKLQDPKVESLKALGSFGIDSSNTMASLYSSLRIPASLL